MDSINNPQALPLLTSGHHSHQHSHNTHPGYPHLCAHPIYDFHSPIFSASEIASIFSPSTSTTSSTSASSSSQNPTWPTLSSRMEHITNRPPTLQPTAICVGEYTSASVAHPCTTHGVGQIFHNWNTHPATKRFRQMIASTPVVQPMGTGPAQILKGYLDDFDCGRSALEGTWVLRFLLVPKASNGGGGGWWDKVRFGGGDWCDPEDGCEREFRHLALCAVREEGMGREEVRRKLVEFGKLFSVEVVVVPSLG
ncbi:hypothetical protein L873DRAFT_1795654 [Choiromyces venosus 120613-1]|uniref:Uncharacterized protein n=1 Tax=Choiromyces venosus 120613-1 TaxID=1336337 RepID=A0A3N4IVC8_9PEZI|nr:hypothetical protein L873DRAFT_1795654 [Choiromyces venosus 120613-1]